MANMKTECETVVTRAKRRKICRTEKDDTLLYKTNNKEINESIGSKAIFDTPEESLSELEECKKRSLPRLPSYDNDRCSEKSDSKIKTMKINCNISENKTRIKSKSPLNGDKQNEKTNIQHSPTQSIECEEYISPSKLKLNTRSNRSSLSSTPQKENVKHKNKKISLDKDILNFKLKKLADAPDGKFQKQIVSSKDDFSHIKLNKKKQLNEIVSCKNKSETERNMPTCSKVRANVTSNDEDSSNIELFEDKTLSSGEECYFNEPILQNSHTTYRDNMIDAISPIEAKIKGTYTFETNSESDEDSSESSVKSNLSMKENLRTPICVKNKNENVYENEYSSESDSQSANENCTPDESKVKTKMISKPVKFSQKSKSKASQLSKENFEVDISETSKNSDESLTNKTQVLRSSSRIINIEENKHCKGLRNLKSKTKAKPACISSPAEKKNSGNSILEESSISSPPRTSTQNSQVKQKKTGVATSSKPLSPKKKKSHRNIKNDLNKNISENVKKQTQQSRSSKKCSSTSKSPRTPSLSLSMNEELGLSWNTKCTPARRYSLRLKKTDSESETPRSRTSITVGSTPSSRREQQFKGDSTNKLKLEYNSESDSDDCFSSSTKRMLKKLVIDNNSPPVIPTSRQGTPRRTPRKSDLKNSNQTGISKTIPKKASHKKLSCK